MRRFTAPLLALLVLVCAAAPAAGKEGAVQSNPDSFLKLGVGARPFGMGGAFTAVADDANACYYNPAGLADMKFWEVNSMHSNSFDFDVNYDMLNLVVPLLPGKALGVSYYGLTTEDIPITRDRVPAVQGYAADKELAYVLTYGHRLSDFVSFGMNAKAVRQEVYIAKANGNEADFGLLYTPSRTVRFGLNFQDALPTTTHWNVGSDVKIPLTVRGGAAFHLHDWGAIIALDVNKVEHRDAEWNGGFEYQFNEMFQGRAGMNNGDPTVGFSVVRGGIRFDYGFQKADLGDTHRFSTGFRFGTFLLENLGRRAPRRPKSPQCGKYPITKCKHGRNLGECKACPPQEPCEGLAPAQGTKNLMTGAADDCGDRSSGVKGGRLKPQPDIEKVLGPDRGAVPAPTPEAEERTPKGVDRTARANKMVLEGKYDEAISLLREVVKADPTNEEAHLKLAGIYQYKKRYEDAIEEYKDAIAVNPANLDSYLNIAGLYAKMKNFDRAAEAAAIVARLAPGTAKARQAEALVKSYGGGTVAQGRKLRTAPARGAAREVAFDEANGADREDAAAEARKVAPARYRPATSGPAADGILKRRPQAALPDVKIEEMGY